VEGIDCLFYGTLQQLPGVVEENHKTVRLVDL